MFAIPQVLRAPKSVGNAGALVVSRQPNGTLYDTLELGMIAEKVLGAYAAIGTMSPTELPPSEQVVWYRRAVEEWKISHFEIPLFAGEPLAPELAEAFADLHASLVVTLVAQWARAGAVNAAYGFSSLDERARVTAMMDANAIVQQCASLEERGVRIRNVIVQTGRRMGGSIQHAIAFHKSLVVLARLIDAVLPEAGLAVEPTDTRPDDYGIAFPGAKRSSLDTDAIVQTICAVNREYPANSRVGVMVNSGRLILDGISPLAMIEQVLGSEVPLVGAIFSGARPTPVGFRDSHNCHLDPEGGFSAADASACATALKRSPQVTFIGMKCSCARGDDEFGFEIEEVLRAQSALLNELAA